MLTTDLREHETAWSVRGLYNGLGTRVNVFCMNVNKIHNLKDAWLLPLLKKPNLDPDIPTNYRPIATVPFLLKILDRANYLQIQDPLETNNLLCLRQSGFRIRHRTETALIDLKMQNNDQNDKGNLTLLLLLDLSAAFDLVSHKVLCNHLTSSAHFSEKATAWIQSFLDKRTMRFFSPTAAADPAPVPYGVPQGSCVSPTLDNLFTEPLFDDLARLGVAYTNYADDTQVLIPIFGNHDNDSTLLNKIYLFIQAWMATHGLCLNDEKTELLLTGSQANLNKLDTSFNSFTIDGIIIPVSKNFKTLGIYHESTPTLTKQNEDQTPLETPELKPSATWNGNSCFFLRRSHQPKAETTTNTTEGASVCRMPSQSPERDQARRNPVLNEVSVAGQFEHVAHMNVFDDQTAPFKIPIKLFRVTSLSGDADYSGCVGKEKCSGSGSANTDERDNERSRLLDEVRADLRLVESEDISEEEDEDKTISRPQRKTNTSTQLSEELEWKKAKEKIKEFLDFPALSSGLAFRTLQELQSYSSKHHPDSTWKNPSPCQPNPIPNTRPNAVFIRESQKTLNHMAAEEQAPAAQHEQNAALLEKFLAPRQHFKEKRLTFLPNDSPMRNAKNSSVGEEGAPAKGQPTVETHHLGHQGGMADVAARPAPVPLKRSKKNVVSGLQPETMGGI
ncbi:uncharacterized protein [Ambystoma mexicanum]|uniref:uncharacterized protein n=1 Tax=Ambystoma mexicanum TaxID=8296 RepID=UPI0037E7A4D4